MCELFLIFGYFMIEYLKMHFQKGAAADGRTEGKETGTQRQGAEVQVPFGLGHSPKAHR